MEFYKGIFGQLKQEEYLHILEVNFYEGEYSTLYEHLLKENTYDIDFYISQGAFTGNRILELACGTGRVGIPLARMGYEVVGIDISADMLRIYEENISKEMRRVKNRIRLIEGDITKIMLNETFDMIILPATTICLFDEEMIRKIFHFVKEHLALGGYFAFDWLDVNYDNFLNGAGEMNLIKWEDQKGFHFAMFQEFLFSDLDEVVVNIYEETVQNDKIDRFIGYTRKHIVRKSALEELIAETGFKVTKDWKYDGDEKNEIHFMVLQGE